MDDCIVCDENMWMNFVVRDNNEKSHIAGEYPLCENHLNTIKQNQSNQNGLCDVCGEKPIRNQLDVLGKFRIDPLNVCEDHNVMNEPAESKFSK